MKKIAFLFLTRKNHNCEELWNIFFYGVPKKYYSIYNHYKQLPSQPFLRNNAVNKVIHTQWAHISLVRATLILLNNAFKDMNNHFFILLSESCVPLVNFMQLRNFLIKTNRPIIHFQHLNNKYNRYRKLHPLIKSKLPFNKFYTQHQWMILTRPYVKLLILNDLTFYFENMDVPDEHYFISIFIILKKNKEIINKKTTYCNWDNRILHPKEYNRLPYNLIRNPKKNFLFFRKASKNFSFINIQKNCLRSKIDNSILNTINFK